MTVSTYRAGSFTFWREEAILRRLPETIEFLHHQAITDQAFYRLEFNFKDNNYSIGVIRPDSDVAQDLAAIGSDAGTLTLELAAFLSPAIGGSSTLIPPPNFPSLADPVPLPGDMRFEDVRTMRGKYTSAEADSAYMLFSPRGFSEFAVVHLRLSNNSPVTILVNPFTGLTTMYRDYRDFEWTYGKEKS